MVGSHDGRRRLYVDLAQRADGPLVELAIGNGRVAIPVAQATGRRVVGIDSSPAMLEQARVRAAEAGVELDLRQSDMRDLALDEPAALICRPGPTDAAPSSAWPRPSVRTAVLRGMPLRSTTGSLRVSTANIRRSWYRTRSGTQWATIGSTYHSTTARRAPSGGRRRTSGSGSSMSPDSSCRRSIPGFPEPYADNSPEYVFVARR